MTFTTNERKLADLGYEANFSPGYSFIPKLKSDCLFVKTTEHDHEIGIIVEAGTMAVYTTRGCVIGCCGTLKYLGRFDTDKIEKIELELRAEYLLSLINKYTKEYELIKDKI